MRRQAAGRFGLAGCVATAIGVVLWATFDDPVLRVGKLAHALSGPPRGQAWTAEELARAGPDRWHRAPKPRELELMPGFVGPPRPGGVYLIGP